MTWVKRDLKGHLIPWERKFYLRGQGKRINAGTIVLILICYRKCWDWDICNELGGHHPFPSTLEMLDEVPERPVKEEEGRNSQGLASIA